MPRQLVALDPFLMSFEPELAMMCERACKRGFCVLPRSVLHLLFAVSELVGTM